MKERGLNDVSFSPVLQQRGVPVGANRDETERKGTVLGADLLERWTGFECTLIRRPTRYRAIP